jgi:hypothetical protein
MNIPTDPPDVSNVSNASNVIKMSGVSDKSGCESNVSLMRVKELTDKEPYITVDAPESISGTKNLTARIKIFIENQIANFTGNMVDNELGLNMDQRNYRSKILHRLCKEGVIRRVAANTYQREIIDVNGFSIFDVNIDPFDVSLPFGLNSLVTMPRKSIMVVAGTTNAGKTQLMLEIMKLNVKKDYDKLYLLSEAPSEYAKRIMNLCPNDDPVATAKEWDANVLNSEMNDGHSAAIRSKCKNGLTVIDYLDIRKDFFLVGDTMSEIHDSIGAGLAVISLQKKEDATHGRGAEMSAERSRLYLSMDKIIPKTADPTVKLKHGYAVLKIVKAKELAGDIDPNGLELHLRMSKADGLQILSESPVFGWVRVHDKRDRERMFAEYAERTWLDMEVAKEAPVPYVETGFTPDEEKVEGLF